jgi:hypothetical protein
VRSISRRKCVKGFVAVLIALAWAALPDLGKAQEIEVQRASGVSVKITEAEIAALPHQHIMVHDNGKTVRFGGVALRLVLEKAGVSLGASLRGKRLASCLLVEASDGYRVVFALPELDAGFTDRVVLLADEADGHPLNSKEGPFRIIVPGDKIMARWVREVTTLEIVQVR